MDVTPLIKTGTQVIQGDSGGQFKISCVAHDGAVRVTPEQTENWDFEGSVQDLNVSNFDYVSNFDIVLLGTGKAMTLLPSELRQSLKDQGISVDVMDTGAACRTYNVLVAEGRNVCALLLSVS